MRKYLVPTLAALLALSLIANVVIWARFNTLRPLVTVGPTSISKRAYLATLDADSGKQVLQKLVFAELVRQAAAKAGVTPTAADVDARIKLLQQKSPALAASEPIWQLKSDVFTSLALENLRIQGVSVTPAEVQQFYDLHKSFFQQPGRVQIEMVISQNATDAATAEHLMQQGYTMQNFAKQPNYKVPGMNGYNVQLTGAANAPLVRKLLAIPPGVTRTYPFEKGQYITAKVFKSARPGYQPLSAVRGDVERMAKLAKAPPANIEIARLYKANPPDFEIDTYKDYFTDVEQTDTSTAAANKELAAAQGSPTGQPAQAPG